ncbi:MAG TPA: hypothetical protein VKS60_08270 [Stellaceae bacterium]|nr:hypothetical protein [Stellaceae bacterium]
MFDIPPAPAAPASDAAYEARVDRHLAMLRRLAELSLNLAEAVDREAASDAPDASAFGGDLALAHARIGQALRRTIALEAKIDDERGQRAPQAEAGGRMRAVYDRHRKEQRERQLRVVVEKLAEAHDPGDAEDLLADLDEQLIGDALTAKLLGDLPLADLAGHVYHDLVTTLRVRRAAAEGARDDDGFDEDPAGEPPAAIARPAAPRALRHASGSDPP